MAVKVTHYTAADIKALLSEIPSPATWRDIVAVAGATHPREIRQLRKILKGLERNQELRRDSQGDYTLVTVKTQALEGVVEASGRELSIAGYSIPRGRAMLRAGDRVSYRIEQDTPRIFDVIEFSRDPVVGTLQWQGRYPYVEAMGLTKGRVGLIEPPAFGDHGDTVQVQISGQDRRGLVGMVTGVVETDSVLEQAITSALLTHQIPHTWPGEVEQAAAKLPKSVQPGRFPDRRNLSDIPLVTIDGETAKDFDDAVFAQPRRGGWRLIVAIADVAHYVKMGGHIDTEAVQRGTSVYFPERVVPMLPEVLSNGLCSLRPQTPRLALVCDMNVSNKGNVTQHEFYEAVIYSHARLTYTQVQQFMDGADLPQSEVHKPDAVASSLHALQAVFGAFQEAREQRGALDFPTREAHMSIVDGRITALEPVQRVDAHRLIEEAMIAANVCAATFLEDQGWGGLYRVHEPPDTGKLEDLRQALAVAGVRLPKGEVSSHVLQSALSRLPKHADQWLYGQLALRTMQQAIYTPNNAGHFGLALQRYMHFTSPIRRYPDLVVHRLIKAILAARRDARGPKIPNADQLVWLGEETSNHERRAESAGWMVDGWLKCDYLQAHVGEPLSGIVAAVTDFGLFVELDGFYVQGLLHVSGLGQDYFSFNARTQSLVGERSGKRYAMGDTLRVVVRHVEPAQGKIDLELAGGKPGMRGGPKGGLKKGRKGGGSSGKRKGKRR